MQKLREQNKNAIKGVCVAKEAFERSHGVYVAYTCHVCVSFFLKFHAN